MADDKPVTQYGVRYPSGKTVWIVASDSGSIQIPGAYGKADASTAAGRGAIIDSWRAQLSGLEVDPDSVPGLRFVQRTITKSFSTPSDVID